MSDCNNECNEAELYIKINTSRILKIRKKVCKNTRYELEQLIDFIKKQ